VFLPVSRPNRIRSASAETKVRATRRKRHNATSGAYSTSYNDVPDQQNALVSLACDRPLPSRNPIREPALSLSPNLNATRKSRSALLSSPLSSPHSHARTLDRCIAVRCIALTSYRCAGVPPGTTMTTATMVGTTSPYRLKKRACDTGDERLPRTPPYYILVRKPHRG